ncbi:motility associated factor glycosyltransferase family protein [Phycisphaerales bacterium AB-hyl4]|uniref:Motility associated factor glycosyltransferase family protein n=1 Tax=Natronomicrosphaera hydrolytica TaxID=3242702 RepID=A0ABV4U3Z5_9BACT
MAEARDMLSANLAALRRSDAELAERLAAAEPTSLAWQASKAGPWTATLEHDGRAMWLASRFDPEKEAMKLVGSLDYSETAAVVALGMGVGHHVLALAEATRDRTLLIVFEPSVPLLRAVLEKVDHTSWLGAKNVLLVAGEVEPSAFMKKTEPYAAVMTQGTKLVVHPPTRQRDPEAIKVFSHTVTESLAYFRTNVATALVNSARTCQNLAWNLGLYHAGETIDDLENAAKGCPAICVAAGPSLVRNVHLLLDPDVRRKVVVIAVQTALKPLLDRGIRPDFVTALDYAAVSKRFYDGLPDLPDVTLVAEPKAHANILDSFPGPVRVIGSSFNDNLLGPLARSRKGLPSGATVAHLSFYLAQYLGCDPIAFIGQDLGFSDGLYYCPGTAVHQVWSSELSPINTLEMMEWQRVVQGKATIRRMVDVNGQPIFANEQMLTYLKQFERDFANAEQTVIDATEGGVAKRHTQRMPLAEVLQTYATQPVPTLPEPAAQLDIDRLQSLLALLQRRVREVHEVRQTCRRTVPLLKQIIEHQRDRARVDNLFARLNKQKRRLDTELKDAFQLVNTLNTVGAYRRARADRAIAAAGDDGYERQVRQLERDMDNVEWMQDACDEVLRILHESAERVQSQLAAHRAARVG